MQEIFSDLPNSESSGEKVESVGNSKSVSINSQVEVIPPSTRRPSKPLPRPPDKCEDQQVEGGTFTNQLCVLEKFGNQLCLLEKFSNQPFVLERFTNPLCVLERFTNQQYVLERFNDWLCVREVAMLSPQLPLF